MYFYGSILAKGFLEIQQKGFTLGLFEANLVQCAKDLAQRPAGLHLE